jgi:protein SCO1/2
VTRIRNVRSAKARPRTIFGVLAVALLLGVSLPAWAQRAETLPKALEGVGITEHPGAKLPLELEFVAENGQPVQLRQFFSGKRPVILTLGYYRCPMLCSLILNGMLDGLKELPVTPGRDFEIVTVSIDPLETPTLAKLKKQSYLQEYGRAGAEEGWHFLTAREASSRALADAVGFGYRYNEERKEYAHPACIFVATPDGRMARYLYGVAFDPKTLRLALTEAGEGKFGGASEQLLLYCFHYDAAEKRYVLAATNVMRAGAGVTALVLGAWLIAWWRRDARARRNAGQDADTKSDADDLRQQRGRT